MVVNAPFKTEEAKIEPWDAAAFLHAAIFATDSLGLWWCFFLLPVPDVTFSAYIYCAGGMFCEDHKIRGPF